jgi:hypothetical protein
LKKEKQTRYIQFRKWYAKYREPVRINAEIYKKAAKKAELNAKILDTLKLLKSMEKEWVEKFVEAKINEFSNEYKMFALNLQKKIGKAFKTMDP